ncbi:PREDICTED: venom carboxylesterase-6-like [Dinoponera quadriceps]|uniref:Carboxylic ester hydrolase n=1 Tax=Dinoponera quadriceps TaxID=609295 RepID=A0A6P3XHM1_DINQU|nr:PREDICTED: venom carboxylesterase-6-like [Dinoponera quadriceps]
MSTRQVLIVLLTCLALAVHATLDMGNPRVRTPIGKLKGYYKKSQNSSRQYEAYEGIPYALPPVGKRRFQPPRAIPAWIGELSATEFGSKCLQYNPMKKDGYSTTGSDDCLYLNIYVPMKEKTAPRTLMPVIFWIHGGCFQFGSGSDITMGHLMDHDIIFVTFNYRLGPLGFLSTEDEVVPGNMGLKDQSMALHWVSDNIEWFGGDPQKVTLIGTSAGAASVHYHYLSPMSAGLFQGGISMSGTAFDSWTQTEKPLEKAKKLGELMGCPTVSSTEMIRCLRYRPANAMLRVMSEFMPFEMNPFTPFGPVVEKSGDIRFIDRTPVEIVTSGDVQDVPWITSTVKDEGLFPISLFINKVDTLNDLNNQWETICPILFDFKHTIPSEKHVEICRLIKEHYFGTGTINIENVKPLVEMAGDRFFIYDSEKAARMQAEVNQNPVWYYRYSYRGANSLTRILSNSDKNYGVCHGDDAFTIILTPWITALTTQDDINMQKHLIDIWISFVTNGTPAVAGVEWLDVDPSKKEFQYLHLAHPDKIYMDSNANLGNKEFWNSIDLDENKLHKTTCIRTEL